MRTTPSLRGRLSVLAVVLPLLLAPACVFKGIAINEPARDELETDDAVRLEARVAPHIDVLTVAVLLDGVDLIQHFGLVPPFTGQGGNVMIGGDLVTISGFEFDPALGLPQLSLDASGLSLGAHDFEISGFRPSDGATVVTTRNFAMIGTLDEKVRAVTSAGMLRRSATFGGFRLGNAAAGVAAAGEPVAYPDGSELRAGVVEAIEARLAGGTP